MRRRTVTLAAAILLLAPLLAAAADLSVPSQYPTLQAALDAAHSGDTVKVQAGHYAGPLTLKDGVSISGDGPDKVVVTNPADAGPVLAAANCATGTLSGMAFEHTPVAESPQQTTQEKPKHKSILYLENCSLTVTDCEVRNAGGNGVSALGKGALTIQSCVVRGARACGIYVQGPDAKAAITKNTLSDNGGTGIYIYEGVESRLEDNTCTSNKYDGIFVNSPKAPVKLSRNICTKNASSGIELAAHTKGSAEQNTCTSNGGSGILLQGPDTSLGLNKNTLTDNAYSGLWSGMDVGVDGKGNDFSRNKEISEAELDLLFSSEEYATLEATADRLRKEKLRFSSGGWEIALYYQLLTKYCGEMGPPQEAEFLRKLEAWKKAYPESITWRIVLARGYSAFAWRERGGDYAQEVSSKGWAGFGKYMDKTWSVLEEAQRLKTTDPEYYNTRLNAALELGKRAGSTGAATPGILNALWNLAVNRGDGLEGYYTEAQKIEPLYFPLYTSRVRSLLPRWGGSPSAVMKFADAASEQTRATGGETVYAVIACNTYMNEGADKLVSQYSFSWPKLEQGFQDLQKQFPDSGYYRNYHCAMACLYQDRDKAKPLFDTIGDYPDLEPWSNRYRYDTFRKWAQDQGPYPKASALEQAILDGHDRKAQELIKAGADVKAPGMNGLSMLVLAMYHDQAPVMTSLLDAGADINAVTPSGKIAILEAVDKTSPAYLTLLLDRGANPNVKRDDDWSPLLLALGYSKSEFANILVNHGADPNLARQSGVAPLQLAVKNGLKDTLLVLLEHGAKPNVGTSGCPSPLAFAVQNNSLDACSILLEHGADPNYAFTDNGTTALFDAADKDDRIEVTRLLVSKGANINQKEKSGWSVFHAATMSGAKNTLQYLLELNPQGLTAVTNDGRTLLQQAAKEGHADIVKLLLEKGADINARESGKNRTALDFAQNGKFTEIVELLRAKGAKE